MKAGSKVKCKHCGDVIQSKYRHDYVECKCGKIAVDGGKDYLRLAYPGGDMKDHLEIVE